MNIRPHELFSDIKIIENFCVKDSRGSFTKIYNDELYQKLGIEINIREVFYSLSQKDVIRGIHFQKPPYEHDKLVHVLQGSVEDVIIDLRKSSPFYKKNISVILDEKNPISLYIPKGFGHGFKALENNTIMMYSVSKGYHKDADSGIRWDSIGFDWKINEPIVSERDQSFITLQEYESEFS